jgi:hypothetical protein
MLLGSVSLMRWGDSGNLIVIVAGNNFFIFTYEAREKGGGCQLFGPWIILSKR